MNTTKKTRKQEWMNGFCYLVLVLSTSALIVFIYVQRGESALTAVIAGFAAYWISKFALSLYKNHDKN